MTELTEAARALLEAGAADAMCRCCLPGKVREHWAELMELESRRLVRLHGFDAYITELGRREIGALSETEATIARLRPILRRKPLNPRPNDDPRTDFDYRAYRTMKWNCTLVFSRLERGTNAVSKLPSSKVEFLGANTSIVQPESEGRFVLVLVPDWMFKKNVFSSFPFPIDEDDPAFTAEERALWDRLRHTCHSINVRIRRGTAKAMPARSLGYGANA